MKREGNSDESNLRQEQFGKGSDGARSGMMLTLACRFGLRASFCGFVRYFILGFHVPHTELALLMDLVQISHLPFHGNFIYKWNPLSLLLVLVFIFRNNIKCGDC